jgi:DNA-binding response OmpR family regulator
MPRTGAPIRVLLVENDARIAVPLARALTRAGFETTTVPSGAQAIETALRIPPDLVLIEGTLPRDDSRAIYHRLKRESGAAVIVLADSSATADRDDALDGADDYVVKPISDRVTIARIHAVLRRTRIDDGGTLVVHGPLLLNPVTQRASLEGRDLRLSRMEYALLERLVRDAGAVISREQLLRDVWNLSADDGGSATLSTHVGLLRRKLGESAAHPHFIHTVPGLGFRFATAPELTQ